MELTEKKIVVTGCAGGIGSATVRAYVSAGGQVIGMDLFDEAGRSVCADASATGPGNAQFVAIDIANPHRVEAAFEEADQLLGGLDALAHTAAIHGSFYPGDDSIDDWDRVFTVNTRGTMLVNQAAHRRLKPSGGGSIINFGSISARRPEPTSAAYSASKGAVHSWTYTAAGAWGVDNVRVNAVLPAIKTPMHTAAWEKATEQERVEKHWRNMHSISLGQDYGDPDRDLGPVMVFLASDASRFITGQLIPVDGGQGNVH